MFPINTTVLRLYILTVMRAYRSRFRTVRSQMKAFCFVAFVMSCGRLTDRTLADAKRGLERELRDAAISKAQAMRIAAHTLRHFKPNGDSK